MSLAAQLFGSIGIALVLARITASATRWALRGEAEEWATDRSVDPRDDDREVR